MKVCIIGCGTIGAGMAQRLSSEHSLVLYGRDPDKVKALADAIGAQAAPNLQKAVQDAEIIVLAVKKTNLEQIAEQLKPLLKKGRLVISVLAGTPIKILKEQLGTTNILRLMPNIAIVYGQGVLGLAEEGHLSTEMKQKTEALCKNLGAFYWIPEDKMDALTALTGSGPAFVFVMIEAMVEAAIALGFNATQGQELVYQMLEGSLKMLRETRKHPAELKWSVASPAGTTIAGLQKMEEANVRHGIIQAFLSAKSRAEEMSGKK